VTSAVHVKCSQFGSSWAGPTTGPHSISTNLPDHLAIGRRLGRHREGGALSIRRVGMEPGFIVGGLRSGTMLVASTG
jgi:hypothetical protein